MGNYREDATSTEMRHDWLADRWVIMAPQRTQRPCDFVVLPPAEVDETHCPFCAGHEECTPSAVACYSVHGNGRDAMGLHNGRRDDWVVRVVPNKFPAVNGFFQTAAVAAGPSPTVGDRAAADRPPAEGIDLFRRRGLTGGHEVIVESPSHLHSISQLDRQATCLVFTAYRDRLRHWLEECKLAYAVVFKNVGQDAGASLAHTHSQLIATDILPPDVERAIGRMRLYLQREQACLFCRMAQDELDQAVRVVEQTPDFVAFCPFASRLPSLVSILPKQHLSQFERLNQPQLEQLSWLMHRLIRRLERCFPDAAYNFIIHTAPSCQRDSTSFHWRLELFPRITKVAGFEWGSDCYINPLPPERAAAALRRAGV